MVHRRQARQTGRSTSDHFTYTVHDDIGGDVLILAAEDVTGLSPAQGVTSAKYADEYAAALAAAGYTSDVYDFDTQGRKAPHHLGRAVALRRGGLGDRRRHHPAGAGQVGGTATKPALDIELPVRDYLNEGGKLLVTRQVRAVRPGGERRLLLQPVRAAGVHDAERVPVPAAAQRLPAVLARRLHLRRRRRHRPGRRAVPAGRRRRARSPGSPARSTAPARRTTRTTRPRSCRRRASCRRTSSRSSPARLRWTGSGRARRRSTRTPATGTSTASRPTCRYKRLTRTVDLTGATSRRADGSGPPTTPSRTGTTCSSRPTRSAPTTGRRCRTPTATPHQAPARAAPRAGSSCTRSSTHYQGADCSPTGTTGAWNAATGASGGWQEWSVDLSAYAGKQVELSITYVSDWGTQGLGVFLDDVRVMADGAWWPQTSFEDGLGGWTVAPPPGVPRRPTPWRAASGLRGGRGGHTRHGLHRLRPRGTDHHSMRADLLPRALHHLLD